MNELAALLLCPSCSKPLSFDSRNVRDCCAAPGGSRLEDGLLEYGSGTSDRASAEMRARDRQAEGYLAHGKFPTQIARLREFLVRAARANPGRLALDLGCGPGPATGMLAELGFRGAAIDVSGESLRRNRAGGFLFARADLMGVRFAPERVHGLVMSDFLQHLGGPDDQARFLREAFAALVPGGWFFLSCFNLNLVNRLRGDVSGGFAGGEILYRRMSVSAVRGLLPACAVVTEVLPMNIFHGAAADRWAARLPFAGHLARMSVLCGRKSAAG